MTPQEIAYLDAYLEYLDRKLPTIDTATLVTAPEAAAWFGVAASTVRSWARRGKVEHVDTNADGAHRYRLAELVAVERTTRSSPYLRRPRSI